MRERSCDDPPMVSVLMAVLQPDPAYFRAAVQSILAQTFHSWELIIVEDPSPSCARDLAAEFNDSRIRYHLNPQRTSLAEQRNRGLAMARAPLVAVFDADDISEPTRLEKEVEYLRAHPEVGVVGSHVCVVNGNGERQGYRTFPLDHGSIFAALSSIVAVCHGSAVFRKALVHEVGGYGYNEQDTVEDYDLLSRLALGGVRFANLPEPLLRYRFHPAQMKATRLHATIRGVLNVKGRYWRNHMTLRNKARMWAERCLLWLPSWLVLRLLIKVLYSNEKPGITSAIVENNEACRRDGRVVLIPLDEVSR